jgi:hypothetical protein
MLDSTLTRIRVPGPVSRPDLRTFVEALRELSSASGFCCSQTFRGIDATDVLLVLSRWERDVSTASLMAAIRPSLRSRLVFSDSFQPPRPPEGRGQEAAPADPDRHSYGDHSAPGEVVGPVVTVALGPCFDVRLSRSRPAATLLRVASGSGPAGAAEVSDRHLALRAIAEPGSIRVAGGRSPRRTLIAWRIEFDLEDALWHFLDSPLRREWSSLARRSRQQETWALNLPRFARGSAAFPGEESAGSDPWPLRSDPGEGLLSLKLRYPSPSAATLRFSGVLGDQGARRLHTVVRSLLRDGCRQLALDIRALETPSPAAMNDLLSVVRHAKAAGAEIRLIERDDRFIQAVRPLNLRESIRALTGALDEA